MMIFSLGLLMTGLGQAMPAEKTKVQAKLMALTARPKVKDIDSYSRALSVYEYKVTQPDHAMAGKIIYVLKWSIWSKRVLDNLPLKAGEEVELNIAPFHSFKNYANDRIIGTIANKSRMLYIDVDSIPKSTSTEKPLLGDGLAKRGIKSDWYFLNDDIRHENAGKYWQAWKQGGEIDTLDVLLDFQQRLKLQGVELLLVPVPTKAEIYSDYLSGKEPKTLKNGVLERLKKEGFSVLDLRSAFLTQRQNSNRLLFCRTDSHWSPEACNMTARMIAELVKQKEWYKKSTKKEYESSLSGLLEIKGDLADAKATKETLPVEYVTLEQKTIADFQPDSPIILLGDSHTLVFSDTAFHADSAGLSDFLALHSGIAVDVVASVGSGMNTARAKLFRNRSSNKEHPQYWKNKKLVIWCFTERELSNPTGLSVKIPLIAPLKPQQ